MSGIMNSIHNTPFANRGTAPVVPQRVSTPHVIPSPTIAQFGASPSRLPSTPDSRKRRRSNRRLDNKVATSKKSEVVYNLLKPLSVMATEAPQIKVEDVSEFVHRSIEIRRYEAEVSGKIKRPLNAFMLYRKAFQNVAKTQSTRNNHQHISSICGESWSSQEPPDIVDKFNELAAIERRMHEQAFPDYRYDPVLAKSHTADLAGRSSDRRPVSVHRASSRNTTPKKPVGYSANNATWSSQVSHPAAPSWVGRGSVPSQSQTLFDLPVAPASHLPTTPFDMNAACTSSLHGSYYPELVVDPSFLSYSQVPAAYPGLEPAMALPTNWQTWDMFPHQFGDSIPDLDIYGGHNQYLRGTDADWEVEKLPLRSDSDSTRKGT